jgi:hypothetical protein
MKHGFEVLFAHDMSAVMSIKKNGSLKWHHSEVRVCVSM